MNAEQLRARCAGTILVSDGAMGTRLRALTGSLDDPDLLNLRAPDRVRQVHREYIDAGADVLTTNSFGASRLRLSALGREADFAAVNREAVAIARSAAESAARPMLIAGCIGPLGNVRYQDDVIRLDRITAEFELQARLLADSGVDFLTIETMGDYREAVAALRAARSTGLAVVAHVTTGNGQVLDAHISLYSAVQRLEAEGASLVGLNCRVGPDLLLTAAREIARYASVPLSLQPNAGNLVTDAYGRMRIEGEPAAFAALADAAPELGAGMVGGCCYTTAEHIAVLREAVDRAHVSALSPRSETGPRPPSSLAEKLARGEFVTCVEIDPPTDEEVEHDPGVLAYKIDGARYLETEAGVDAFTVADHTMGHPWLDGFPFCEALRPHLQRADILLHYTCRNKAETDVAGNFGSFKLYGYRNILIITGDKPVTDKSFYVYSSPNLIQRVRAEHGDRFFIACSFDHNRGHDRAGDEGIDLELKRLARKVAAGAQVALTQPIFDVERVRLIREKTRDVSIPILAGIMPILSVRHAERVNEFPGIRVPESAIARLAEAGEDRAERARISIEMASEIARAIEAEGFAGIYLITPLNRFDVIRHIIGSLDRSPCAGGA